MSTEGTAEVERQWDAPPPAAPEQAGWSGRTIAAAIAVAVVVAGGGGAAIYAATAHDRGGPVAGPEAGPVGRGRGGPAAGPGFQPDGGGARRDTGSGVLFDALHGEFVLADGTVDLLQTGKITEVSAGSIAVTSDDGYAKKYTIDSSTQIGTGGSASDLGTGEVVTVISAKTDGVAVSISDRTRGGPGADRQQPPPPSR
ncbi:MAG: hypothetical protein ACJ72N_10590 [Labedaea sp.]